MGKAGVSGFLLYPICFRGDFGEWKQDIYDFSK